MITTKNRLIIAGLAQNGAGLTAVMNALATELKESWQVLVFAHGVQEKAYSPLQDVETITACDHDWTPTTQFAFKCTLEEFQPAVVLIIGHPWKSPAFKDVAEAYGKAKLAVYMPVEGKPIGCEISQSLKGFDLCITYTQFVAAALKELPVPRELKLANVGHGIDSYFKPLSRTGAPFSTAERIALRKSLFPNHPEFWERPMLLNSNRKYWRKRLDLTIKAFAIATKQVDASLYLNVAAVSRYEKTKLLQLIREHKVEDRVMLNQLNGFEAKLAKAKLLELYNACDIGISTSMGEGWGLCLFEHGATGSALIVPEHSSFTENWPVGTAVKFKADLIVKVPHDAAEMYQSEPTDIATAIIDLLAKEELLKKCSTEVYKHTQHPEYQWKIIGKQFNRLLADLLTRRAELLSTNTLCNM